MVRTSCGLLALVLGCSRATPAPPVATVTIEAGPAVPVPPAAVAAIPSPPAVTASVSFCAFGGQGVMPIDASFDDYVRVIATVDLVVPAGRTVPDVKLSSIELRGADAGPQALMRKLISVGRVDPTPAKETWAAALAPDAGVFDGVLREGTTRLRIEAWLTRHPELPQTVRVFFAAPGGFIEADGHVQGEWPTG